MRASVTTWGVMVKNLHRGWHPYRRWGRQDSWRSLADARKMSSSKRRYWNGTKWEGPTQSNHDVVLAGPCTSCGIVIAGASFHYNPIRIVSGLKDIVTIKSAFTVQRLQCSLNKSLCPHCANFNIANSGASTCRSCGGKYQIIPGQANLPPGVDEFS